MKTKKKNSENINKIWQKMIVDWPAKVICLIIAVLLYIVCQITTLDRKSFAVPLEVKNTGTLTATNSIPKNIRVSARGESNEVGLLQEKDFKVFIDTGSYVTEGTYKVPIQVELSEEATMIDPLEIQLSPDTITLELDRKISDLKQIKINTRGKCAAGYEVSDLKIEPDLVQITGNSRQVNATKYLETNVVDIEGKKDTVIRKVKLLNLNSMIDVTGNSEFLVTITITPVKLSKEFETKDLYYLGLTSKLAVENDQIPVKISLAGNQNDIEAFNFTPHSVYLDCSDVMEDGEYELPVLLDLPANIKVEKIEPASLNIKIIKASKKQELIKDNKENAENRENVENSENIETTEKSQGENDE
ncbi:MAG: hypothetical protein K5839_07400 [Treponemataceae bacterium]|nr:hypothetical protein [Treponemataceae bacterium]